MWPYEYFNQYSALINEFILDRNKEWEWGRSSRGHPNEKMVTFFQVKADGRT